VLLNRDIPVINNAESRRLAATGAQTRLVANATPQARTQCEANQHVQHRARLLRIKLVHINPRRTRHGRFEGRLRDLVEDDARRRGWIQAEELTRMPGNRLSLTVIIRPEIDFCS